MSVGIAIMQPAMAAAVREWMPERAAFGTAVYTNGLDHGRDHSCCHDACPSCWPISPAIGARRSVLGHPPDRHGDGGCDVRAQIAASCHGNRSRWLPRLNSRLNWRIGITLGSITSTYFCPNGFLPAC